MLGSLKNAIGKPRPDLIDRCQPNITMISGGQNIDLPTIVGQFGLSNHSICTQTDNAILKDGFRSFPSGHSSSKYLAGFSRVRAIDSEILQPHSGDSSTCRYT